MIMQFQQYINWTFNKPPIFEKKISMEITRASQQ